MLRLSRPLCDRIYRLFRQLFQFQSLVSTCRYLSLDYRFFNLLHAIRLNQLYADRLWILLPRMLLAHLAIFILDLKNLSSTTGSTNQYCIAPPGSNSRLDSLKCSFLNETSVFVSAQSFLGSFSQVPALH